MLTLTRTLTALALPMAVLLACNAIILLGRGQWEWSIYCSAVSALIVAMSNTPSDE